MANYVKSTNFTSKDSLPTGNPLKVVRGSEFDTEFNAIATAVATKADTNSPEFTGVPLAPTAASGTNTTQIATTAFVTAAVAGSTPTGAILPFAGTTAPTGFLLCNGQTLLRTTYSALFAILGTTYGTTDSTNFKVPDLRNRTVVGSGDLYTLGSTGGSKDAIVVSHDHGASTAISDPGHTHVANVPNEFATGTVVSSGVISSDGVNYLGKNVLTSSSTTGISASTNVFSTGSSGTDKNMQPYMALNYIIKT